MVEKSGLTEMGAPQTTIMKKSDYASMYPQQNRASDEGSDDGDAFGATYKTESLVEFMNIESQIKQSTINSKDGSIGAPAAQQVFVGDSFRDELADSVGTQLTEIVQVGSKRMDDSILREEQERQSFQRKHGLMN